jgi:hypothetical protein
MVYGYVRCKLQAVDKNYTPLEPYANIGFRGMGWHEATQIYGFVTPMPRKPLFS